MDASHNAALPLLRNNPRTLTVPRSSQHVSSNKLLFARENDGRARRWDVAAASPGIRRFSLEKGSGGGQAGKETSRNCTRRNRADSTHFSHQPQSETAPASATAVILSRTASCLRLRAGPLPALLGELPRGTDHIAYRLSEKPLQDLLGDPGAVNARCTGLEPRALLFSADRSTGSQKNTLAPSRPLTTSDTQAISF